MRGYLSRETRLGISVTRLKKGTALLREKLREAREIIKEKDAVIADLRSQLVDKEAHRKELLPFLYKPKKEHGQGEPRGKRPGSPAYHRAIPKDEDVTESATYTLKKCPICQRAVGDVVDTVIKYEEDIALKPRPIIKKHTITRHWCSQCETYVKAQNIPPIHRIGINTLGYILYARYRLRLPFEKIRESLRDLYDFKLSEGEISEKLQEARVLFGEDHDAVCELIKQARRVYADETGWRMNGAHWWLWVFVTDKEVRYVIEDTRGKGVPARVLGEKEDRVIISDGYATYRNLHGDKQQCWVHLLRKAKLHCPLLYEDLTLLYKKLLIELEKPIMERDRDVLMHTFDQLIEKKYPNPEAHLVTERMQRHRTPLFTCLDHDGVLPENNTAERMIRPQVVMRKISGGSRSLGGVMAHQVNTSVIETLRMRNPDASFFDVVLPLLAKRREGQG